MSKEPCENTGMGERKKASYHLKPNPVCTVFNKFIFMELMPGPEKDLEPDETAFAEAVADGVPSLKFQGVLSRS